MNKINLVGERFAMLTVVSEAEKAKDGKLQWNCVCECGGTSVVKGNNLKGKGSKTKSCGCLLHKSQRVDITGEVFGRLTVIGSASTTDKGVAFWECSCSCGKTTAVSTGHLKSGHTKSCGCLVSEVSRKWAAKHLAGKKKVSPNGSLPPRTRLDGYVRVHDRTHSRANSGGFVLEHIVVMEEKIGRSLLPRENVHHLNGQRGDNSPENLELWSVSQPCGQRVVDKLSWALSLLVDYSDQSAIEDLKKAKWYIEREINKREEA